MKRRLFVLIVLIALTIIICWVLTDTVGAAPLNGNRGGCAARNVVTVQCEVSDSGPGYVSGNCAYGYWFSRVSTARAFRIGAAVTVRGCEGLGGELYAPIRISR